MTSLIRSEWQTGKGKARVITTALDMVACIVMWLLVARSTKSDEELLRGLYIGLAYGAVVAVLIGGLAQKEHGFFAALKGNFTRACLVTLVLFVTVANAYS